MFPTRLHSHYTLLESTIKPDKLAKSAKELGYSTLALTDVSSVAGCVKFMKACHDNDIKPILGCEITIKESDGKTITLLCRNVEDWRNLLKIISISNNSDNFDLAPSISLEGIAAVVKGGFVCIDGYRGSLLDSLMSDPKVNDYLEYNKLLFSSYYTNVPDVQVNYLHKEDVIDQRLLLCTKMKSAFKKKDDKLKTDGFKNLSVFFETDEFYLPSHDRLSKMTGYESLVEICGLCEDFDILSMPNIPHFPVPEGKTEDQYLRELCRDGWRKKIKGGPNEANKVYIDRVNYELAQISDADLAGYFLIVQDYVKEFKSRGYMIGSGRGSGAGSLVGYLLGITGVDPIQYGLLWERFYTKDRVGSLPDYDIDFQPECRDDVVLYLKELYGEGRVSQMITFGRLQGRSALKEVLRVHDSCSFEEMNAVTNKITSEAAISDKLEEMENPSAIMWSLENDPAALSDYCRIGKDGLEGQYAEEFNQALRIEGLFRSVGKHAAGVIVSSSELNTVCPMIKSKNSDELIAGLEMGDLEALGCVKFDILGLSLLSVLKNTVTRINNEKLDVHSKKD